MKLLLVVAAVMVWSTTVGAATDLAIVPDPTLTPGVVRTTDVGEICSQGTRELRHWSREGDDRILIEYGFSLGHNFFGHGQPIARRSPAIMNNDELLGRRA
jgi:hypothetical protein